MGKNKNTFKAAVSEMKYFLAGSALVLALVVVVPVFAQSGGMGGSMGGMGGSTGGMGGGMGGSMGGMGGSAGGMGGSMGGMGGSTGGMSGQQMGQMMNTLNQMGQQMGKQGQGMGQQSGKQGQQGMGMGQQSGKQGQQGMGMGQQQGMGMGQQGMGMGQQSGKQGQQGMGIGQQGGKQGQQGMGQGQRQSGNGSVSESNPSPAPMPDPQMRKGVGQQSGKQGQMGKKVAPKPLDATKLSKAYDKALSAIKKANDQFITKVAKAKTAKKVFSLSNTAIMNAGKFCKITQAPKLPIELDLEEFDCQGYIEGQLASLLDLKDSFEVAETDEEKTAILGSAKELVGETLIDGLSTAVSDVKTAVEDGVAEFNTDLEQEQENVIEEEPMMDQQPAGGLVPTTDSTNTGL